MGLQNINIITFFNLVNEKTHLLHDVINMQVKN